MTTITEHLEQENETLRRQVKDLEASLAQSRRAAADRNAELARELVDKKNVIGCLSDELAAEREARRGLARDLGKTNGELTTARESIRHYRVVELKAKLLLVATEEDMTGLNVVDAGRDLRRVLEGR